MYTWVFWFRLNSVADLYFGEKVHSLYRLLEAVAGDARRGFGAVMVALQPAAWGRLRAAHLLLC